MLPHLWRLRCRWMSRLWSLSLVSLHTDPPEGPSSCLPCVRNQGPRLTRPALLGVCCPPTPHPRSGPSSRGRNSLLNSWPVAPTLPSQGTREHALSWSLWQNPSSSPNTAMMSCVLTTKLQGCVRVSHSCSDHTERCMAGGGAGVGGGQEHPAPASYPQQWVRR